jgi:outer membrane lipoprotein-sorting protein
MIRRSPGARLIVVVLAAVVASSCAAPLLNLPVGPGAPAPDAREVLAGATNACRAVSSMTADASVGGSAGGRRLRARLSLGVQAPASARLEAVGPFARPVFTLAASGNTATLLLHDDNRILDGAPPQAVLEALTGVPLDAAALRDALTGCTSEVADPNAGEAPGLRAVEGRQVGDDWRVIQDGTQAIYLNRNPRTGPWRLVATVHRPADAPEWRAEYRDFVDGLPKTVRLVSGDSNRFNLRLELRDVELNPKLPAEAFEVRIPPSARPITLDEVRRVGPLREER